MYVCMYVCMYVYMGACYEVVCNLVFSRLGIEFYYTQTADSDDDDDAPLIP